MSLHSSDSGFRLPTRLKRLLGIAVVGVTAVVGACNLPQSVATLIDPEASNKPRQRSSAQIRELSNALFGETVRLLTNSISDSITRRTVWKRNEWEEKNPPAPAPHGTRMLFRAFAEVPRSLMDSIIWHDSLGTFASPDIGLVISSSRLAQLTWLADSAVLTSDPDGYRSVILRHPGDYLLVALMGHELAHLALHYSGKEAGRSPAIAECAADVVAGVIVKAVGPRMSTRAFFDLTAARLGDSFARDIAPGHWVAGEAHPDGEQRRACLATGFALFDGTADHLSIAGNSILHSARDSIIDQLALHELSILEAALSEASRILSMRSESQAGDEPGSPTRPIALGNPEDQVLADLARRLIARMDTTLRLDDLRGPVLTTGVSLFPSAYVHELRIPVKAPWKCAVLPRASGRNDAVVCYAFDPRRSYYSYAPDAGIVRLAALAGFRITAVGPSLARDAGVDLGQWLIERDSVQMGPTARAVISLYRQRAAGVRGFSEISGDLRWFSFSPIVEPHVQPPKRR